MTDYGRILSTLQIEVLDADKVTCGREWNHEGINSPFTRLYYVTRGEGVVMQSNRVYKLLPGTLTIIPAHSTCALHCHNTMEVSYLHITARVIGSLSLFQLLPPPLQIKANNTKIIKDYYSTLISTFNSRSITHCLQREAAIRSLLAMFFQGLDNIDSTTSININRFKPALACIQNNLGNKITTSFIARQSGLHPTYFANLFTRTFNKSPRAFILDRKIEAAKNKLWATDQNMDVIAEALGFSDGFHFSKTFKRLTGIPPKQFRKQKELKAL